MCTQNCAALWWQSRKRGYAVAAIAVGVSILGYFLLDRLVESDREQMIRKVREMLDSRRKK